MTPTKEQARAAMSRIVNSLDDCTDCVTVIDYIVALEQEVAVKYRAIERLIDEHCDRGGCSVWSRACQKPAVLCTDCWREWAMREPEQEES